MNLWTPNNDIAVSIGGKPLFSFKSLRLHQPINDHHRFELALDFEVAAKALEDGTEWLGKRIQIKRREAKSFLFVGVVTQVNACRENLDGGEVRVSGYSTTYLLENGESCHSWLGRTLGEIVRELCAKAGVQAQVEPEHDKSVGYVCQYRESDFTFIRRLAKKYQEWLYYDGARLVFGMPRKPKAVKLEFDTTLTSFETGACRRWPGPPGCSPTCRNTTTAWLKTRRTSPWGSTARAARPSRPRWRCSRNLPCSMRNRACTTCRRWRCT